MTPLINKNSRPIITTLFIQKWNIRPWTRDTFETALDRFALVSHCERSQTQRSKSITILIVTWYFILLSGLTEDSALGWILLYLCKNILSNGCECLLPYNLYIEFTFFLKIRIRIFLKFEIADVNFSADDPRMRMWRTSLQLINVI